MNNYNGYKLFNFNDEPILDSDIVTTFKNKILILKNVFLYDGPITMQYLPNGGIQGVINGLIIINSAIGFIATNQVEYDRKLMTSKEFISLFANIVNEVLPN